MSPAHAVLKKMLSDVKIITRYPGGTPEYKSHAEYDVKITHTSYEELFEQLHTQGMKIIHVSHKREPLDEQNYAKIDPNRVISVLYVPV